MARAHTYRETVVVLSQTKLSEQDLIITCLTKNGALLQAVAKGARKPTGKLAGKSQVLTLLDALFAKGRSLDILTDARVLEVSPKEIREMHANAAVSVLCEVARGLAFEDSVDPYVFPLFLTATKAIVDHAGKVKESSAFDIVLGAYIFKLFAHTGWYPQLNECSSCGSLDLRFFNAQEGGALCEACGQAQDDSFYLSEDALCLLQSFLTKRFSELAYESNPDTARLCLQIAFSWAATHASLALKTAQVYLALS